jgi:G:T-mismatch repair DNA endonuclease (very short patch repair protein)
MKTTGEKISAALLGRPLSLAHRAKLSAAKKGKPGNPSPWKGKKLSDDHRAAMRRGQKARMARPGEKERLAALARAPEQRARQRAFALSLHRRPARASGLERFVALILESWVPSFVSQYQTTHFSFDFAIPARRILIEVDGCYWHGCQLCDEPGIPKTVRLDKLKDAWAKRHKWKLIRVKGHEVETFPWHTHL